MAGKGQGGGAPQYAGGQAQGWAYGPRSTDAAKQNPRGNIWGGDPAGGSAMPAAGALPSSATNADGAVAGNSAGTSANSGATGAGGSGGGGGWPFDPRWIGPAVGGVTSVVGAVSGGGGGGGSSNSPFNNNQNGQPNFMNAANMDATAGVNNVNQQTQNNRPDQYTDFGGQQWVKNGLGQWVQSTSLNGTLGGALGNLQGQAYNNSVNGPQDIAQARQQAIDANYNQATSRLDPQFNQGQEQLNAQLANQGIDPSSAAGRAAALQFSQAKNDAYSSAMNNAIGMGNQTEQTQLQAQLSPYQQMGYLQGFENNLPGFNAAGLAPTPNYLGATVDMGNYNLKQATQSQQNMADMYSGIGQMGSAAAGLYAASDERVKHDVQRFPMEAAPGVPLAAFSYNGKPGRYVGVIAQDLEKVAPEHVREGPDGVKQVSPQFRPFRFK